ncbi:Armadillo-like helical [Corchorus olitorius]|uniref:Armadillo-like helical n=1 Tax=Corchorus olitorius TaxID=93759 RepID=A0A1R3K3Z9_9ROSI|nr:Armadillo-like helical [Corchorus olitorius]
MEKRLRSSLQSSAEDFLSSAVKQTLKSSKPTLKSLIHSISPSSPLCCTLPPCLHLHISDSILSFQNPPSNPEPEPDLSHSPPTKRTRRSTRSSKPPESTPISNNENLRILACITGLCVSHPRNVFGHADLIPAVRSLHENLILFESDSNLSNEVACLCEEWWKQGLPGKETLISQTLPFLLSKSLTLKKKVDIHRVHSLREAFNFLDFEDESIEDLKLLLIRCVIEPLYLKTDEGKRFVAFTFGLSLQFLKECLAMIKAQIPFGRKSMLEAYGLASSIRRVLGGFINQRTVDGVEKLLFRLAEPVLFRSLQVANSNVRQNALHLLLDLFPFEDPDSTKEAKDTLLDKQFFLLDKLLLDDCPDVRVIAVEGCCRILHLFWEVIPSSTITKMITKIIDQMAYDSCNEVRLSTLNGIIYLLGNPQSHEILKVLLPRLGNLMLDNALSIRVAMVDLLLLLKDIRSFQFNTVVNLEVLLNTLANDQPSVARKITRLLMPSYFPARLPIEEACNRCVTLMKRSPLAGARFCEFALLEGASLKSLMELVKVFISLVVSKNKLDAAQIEGLLVASANICSSLAKERSQHPLKELFSGERVKSLFAVASTARAKSSVFDILSTIASENVAGILGDCMSLVTNCSDLSENVEKQAEVRSAHKLLMSCDAFDDIFEALTRLLQKTAYRCHIKFDTEAPKQNVSPAKRKRGKSSTKLSAKWKHVSKKKSSDFEDDYLVSIGVSWQIKDMLASEDTQKAILGSQALELPFLALKIISEVSIVQCEHYEYMDPYPVLAYTALALQMALQNDTISNVSKSGLKKDDCNDSSGSIPETMLEQVMDHLLNCTDKLFEVGDSEKNGKSPKESKQEKSKRATRSGQKQREPRVDVSSSSSNGSVYTKQKQTSKKVKMLTAVLKFIVDSIGMGFASGNHGRCLKFTSAYMQYIISSFRQLSTDKSQLKEEHLKELILCVKSSFSYATKLLNLVLNAANQASPAPVESFNLANDLLDLIVSGSATLLKQSLERAYMNTLDHIKLHFPSWPLILAKIELSEMKEGDPEEEDDRVSEPEFPEFKKLMGIIISMLKGNRSILDAVGMIFMVSSVVGLERKDFGLLLGLLRFVCLKLIGQEDREWTGLDRMLISLPDIYPRIEREVEELGDEDGNHKLHNAKALLEPVWLYHVYETERFSEMEE